MRCWFKNEDDVWEMGKVLTWSTDSECRGIGIYRYPVAVVRCTGGRVRSIYVEKVLLEEPEGWV